jgi:DNA-binding LacI/PurR family transcriptional regulator
MSDSVHPETGRQPRDKAPSIRDVAELAGVSHQTVSRVLNHHSSIKPTTVDRVLAAIADLGYRPNRAARMLATARNHTIGLLVTAPEMYGPSSVSLALEHAARERGYTVSTVSVTADGEQAIAEALDELMAHGVEGLVIIAPQQRTYDVVTSAAAGVPSVTLQWRGGSGTTVYLDQYAGARLATRHLAELGHSRILHVAGPAGWAEVEERTRGYTDEMIANGLVPLPPVVGDWTADAGYAVGRALLRERTFTAVFSSNDQMALGLLHAANELGVSVPKDLSLVGFDDIPEARHYTPPLTTVRQDFAVLGRRAIAALVSEIETGSAPTLPESGGIALVVRDSAAPILPQHP